MTRITYHSEPGVFEKAFLATHESMERAAQAAVKAAGEQAKTEGRAHILSAGLGSRFSNALRVNVYPNKGASLNAAALIYHKIPYAGVFEEGATIRGKPRLWLPLSSTPAKYGRYRLTPERYAKAVGPLQYVKRPGKAPLLVAKIKAGKSGKPGKPSLSRLKAGAKGQGETISVPLFVGLDSVTIRKRLDIRGIVARARDRLADFYTENMRSD